MELVGIGDLHFDKLDSIIPDASELICKSVERVLDYALDRGIPYVIFYGDVGEKPRLSYHAQVQFYKTMLKKRYRDLYKHVILGNHDFAEDGTHSLQVLELIADMMGRNLTVHTKQKREILGGVAFNMLPYPYTTTTKNAINVGHFEVSGSLRDNGRKIEEGIDTRHVTLMGHLHTCHRVRNTHYSGTLYQTNFGEALPKSFHHVSARSHRKEDVSVLNMPFEPPFKLINLTVSKESDLKQIEDDPRVLYKLFLKDGVNIDIDRVLDAHSNVVRHNVFKNKKELELMVTQAWEFDEDVIDNSVNIDDEALAMDFLSQAGFSKDKIKRGRELLSQVTGRSKTKER